MGRWQQGAADIQRFVDARHLQQVTADSETPQALLAAAERHIKTARLAAEHDHEGAYSMRGGEQASSHMEGERIMPPSRRPMTVGFAQTRAIQGSTWGQTILRPVSP